MVNVLLVLISLHVIAIYQTLDPFLQIRRLFKMKREMELIKKINRSKLAVTLPI